MKNEEFINWIDSLKKSEPSFLANSQRKAQEELKKKGLPSKKLEDWRVTNLDRFKKILNLPISNNKQSQSIKLNVDEIISQNNLPKGIEIIKANFFYGQTF